MLKGITQKRSGSAFIVVIGILGIIIFAATMFMSSTIQEGKETTMSIRGLHSASLAEAGLERAMSIILKDINNIDLDKTKANDLSITLRLPAKEKSSALAQTGSLGTDKELNLDNLKNREFEFNKADLETENSDLKNMVSYMTNDGHKDFEVNVKAKIEHAFRVAPGDVKPDYKIPGVDIPWNARRDVRSLLDGNGYTALHFRFPDSMRWFELNINLLGALVPGGEELSKYFKLDILSIDLVGIASKLLENTGILTGDNTLEHITTLDWVADKLMNKIIKPIAETITGSTIDHLYPIDIMFAKGDMPTTIADLWPSGTDINGEDNQYLEKYGQITFDCEAKITYKDGYTSARRINAVKDFKVSDCEPPASMYSLFIANEKNEEVAFNNYGGELYVNNMSYSNLAKDAIEKIQGGLKANNNKDMNKKEFPGLIRVNAKPEEPIFCNIGFLGDWESTKIVSKNKNGELVEPSAIGGTISKVVNGDDIIMLVTSKTGDWTAARASFEYGVEVKEKKPDSDGKKYSTTITKQKEISKDGLKDALSVAGLNAKLNIIPKLKTCSLVQLGICLAVMPFAQTAANKINQGIGNVEDAISEKTGGYSDYVTFNPVGAGQDAMKNFIEKMDCFATWEWPYFGTSNELYTIPNLGRGSNKTHLFGYGALHPTLTKEIEGDVVSQYRQWRMVIVGFKATEKIYVMGVPIPPIPIPLWKTTTQVKKYGYHITGLKSLNEDGDDDDKTISVYDPATAENMVPNLYTCEQYAKKATYYYDSPDAFVEDIQNRTTTIDGKEALVLNGVTYIAGSLGSENEHFKPNGKDTLYVVGKGMIVVSGNVFLGCNIVCLDKSEDEKTTFSLICRNGGLIIVKTGRYIIEGSLYTEAGVFIEQKSSLHIVGNWVTNQFKKPLMSGTIIVDYLSSRTRTSIGSLHPTRGKYDPKRYQVSFSPIWSTWRAY